MIKSNIYLARLVDLASNIRNGAIRFTTHPRYKLYKNIVWGVSLTWMAVVVAQSLPYYTYMAQAKSAQGAGLYGEAESLYRLALQDVRTSVSYSLVGPRDGRFANALNNLAELHRLSGNYAAAESEYRELLSIAEKHMGKNSEPYALTLNNLGALYRDQGRYAESEQFYKRAIACWVDGLKRTGDTRYAASLNGLGRVFRDQGRFEDAAAKFKQGLDIRRAALGPDHPDVAEIEGNLAGVYRDTKDYAGAQTLYEHALGCDVQAFGSVHPFVATDLNNLGGLLRDMGRYDEALDKINKSLSLREQILIPNHPHIAKSLLGRVETSMLMPRHNWDKMIADAHRALQISANSLGKLHPDYATACDTMSALQVHGVNCSLCKHQGSLKLAREFNATTSEIRRGRLPPGHPDVIDAAEKAVLLARLQSGKSALHSSNGQAPVTEKGTIPGSK